MGFLPQAQTLGTVKLPRVTPKLVAEFRRGTPRLLGDYPLVNTPKLEKTRDLGVELGHRHGVLEQKVRYDEGEGFRGRDDILRKDMDAGMKRTTQARSSASGMNIVIGIIMQNRVKE
ncbi:hypothetical protein NE237_026450 [Protea cynaroides]|uniref:Uncharacterized protein n=1 Tax=Protea cynaroides TaxID=273540 RepID=A0A9Q0H515_9MAGN|nr:hypothetical protein NE237_026450 [Protea cynaroides]